MTLFNPKFLTKNAITAVSQLADSASTTDAVRFRLIDRSEDSLWQSIGDTSTPWTITWTPTAATSINRIYVQGANWGTFTIKYNGSSTFSTPITQTAGHGKSNWYFEFNSVSVTTVDISITALESGTGSLAYATQLYIGTELFMMESSAAGTKIYIPRPAQVLQQLSDGGMLKVFIKRNLDYEIRLIGVTSAERLNYLSLYNYNKINPFVFIPEPQTGTSWDGIANHYNWTNGFDVENFTDNSGADGYNAIIQLAQSGGGG